MKKLLFLIFMLFIISVPSWAQDFVQNYSMVNTGIGNPVPPSFANTGVTSFFISWSPQTSMNTCSVQVDSSSDGSSWGSGDLIASQTCTTVGSAALATLTAGKNFVRVHVTAMSGNGGLNVTLKGWGGGGGGGSSSSVGPVINVTSLGASPTLADNATAFTAVAAAANAAAYVSVGTPTIRSTVKTPMTGSTISSAVATVNISAGDTVLVGMIALNGAGALTYTVSDGTNVYYPVNLTTYQLTTNEQVQVFGTVAGAAKAFSGTLTVTISAGGPAQFGFIVLDAFNVGSYGQTNLFNFNASTATPSVTAVTQDSNNIIATWADWCNAAGVAISANTGTLQQSWASTASLCGGALITNTAASALTSLTTSGTLGSGSAWTVNGIELRSVTTVAPTIYFPAGRYTYTSGLNFTQPVTLKGEPGSVLCYGGTAHAIDLGPTGLLLATAQVDPYIVDGLRFECGAGMTQGIVFQNNILWGEVRNNVFYNFGNITSGSVNGSAAIFSNGDTEDMHVFNNRFLIFDGPPAPANVPSRKFVDVTVNSSFSTLTMTNNYAACIAGKLSPGVGCGTLSGPLVTTQGYANIISNNNVGGGFCPAFALVLSGNGAADTRVQNNNIEVDQNNCMGITYTSTLDGFKVLNNYFNNKCPNNLSCNLLGPKDGTQLLTAVEVSSNVLTNNPAANPVVAQNNLAGQTANTGWHNVCSTVQYTPTVPCPLLHTLGGNITQWNADYAGTCTLTTGACPVFNFLTTYGAVPRCTASWTGTGTFTGILKVLTSTTQLTITDTVNESTGVVNWVCSPDAQ